MGPHSLQAAKRSRWMRKCHASRVILFATSERDASSLFEMCETRNNSKVLAVDCAASCHWHFPQVALRSHRCGSAMHRALLSATSEDKMPRQFSHAKAGNFPKVLAVCAASCHKHFPQAAMRSDRCGSANASCISQCHVREEMHRHFRMRKRGTFPSSSLFNKRFCGASCHIARSSVLEAPS